MIDRSVFKHSEHERIELFEYDHGVLLFLRFVRGNEFGQDGFREILGAEQRNRSEELLGVDDLNEQRQKLIEEFVLDFLRFQLGHARCQVLRDLSDDVVAMSGHHRDLLLILKHIIQVVDRVQLHINPLVSQFQQILLYLQETLIFDHNLLLSRLLRFHL